MILDFRRVHEADQAARRLIMDLLNWLDARGRLLLFANLPAEGALQPLHALLAERFGDLSTRVFGHRDEALEWCENKLVAERAGGRPLTKFALSELNIFAGLSAEELKVLERIVKPLMFEPGQAIVREGEKANLFFVIARGTASVQLRIKSGEGTRVVRVASIGPGVSFGEMALLDGGLRSADVIADEKVVCYGFSVEELRDIGKERPNLFITILRNMMRDSSERLRRANDEIRALEQ
jgi:glutaminase